MIEVSLAITAAAQAVSTIKKGMRAGRDAQDLASQFATFFDAKDKIDGAKSQSQNNSIGRKVFAKQSVEAYALEVALAEEKAKDLEKHLRELFVYSGQGDVYKNMMRLRQKERQRRLKAARVAAERKRLIADIFWVGLTFVIISGMFGILVYELF